MTDKEIQQRLRNFEAVWQRVQSSRPSAGGAQLMPRKEPKSRAVRFDPRCRYQKGAKAKPLRPFSFALKT